MQNDGCIVLLLVGGLVVAPVAAFIFGARQQKKAAIAQQRQLGEQQWARGLEITRLYEQITVGTAAVASLTHKLLSAAPVGYHPDLIASGGWFDRVAPHLQAMLRSDSTSAVAERYFALFNFPTGYQAKALDFLNWILRELEDGEQSVLRFQRIAEPVLARSSPQEAQWLYARALELVRESKGTPTSKALALYIGRHSYSASRRDRIPTVYDEQAIANDIAARVA